MKSAIAAVIGVVCLCLLVAILVFVIRGGQGRPAVPTSPDEILDAMERGEGPRVVPSLRVTDKTLIDTEAQLRKVCDSIMTKMVAGNTEGAFALIKQHCPLSDAELDPQAKLTTRQLKMIKPRFGSLVGYELIAVESAGKSAVRFSYMLKCEKHVLRWRFVFYRPKDKWLLNSFKWDDKISECFTKVK